MVKYRGLLIALCAVVLFACGSDATIHPNVAEAKITVLKDIPPNAERVTVGVYPTIINSLDISSSTYDVTAYIWFKWKGPIDPTKHLEFVNLVQRYDFTRELLYEHPVPTPGGGFYQIMQIHGRFFQPFELEDFPFDTQNLSVIVQDEYRAHENVVYIPDTEQSGFAAGLEIPGWQIKGWRAESVLRDYGSRFGAPSTHLSTKYPGLRFEMVITRHVNYFLWKLFLPLLIIVFANWLALLIDPELVDVRTALPATSLLTLVFLQQTYSSELPEVGTLVLMDKIYAWAYFLVIATLVQVIAMASWQKGSEVVLDARVQRIDRIVLGIEVALFAVVVLSVVLSAKVLG